MSFVNKKSLLRLVSVLLTLITLSSFLCSCSVDKQVEKSSVKSRVGDYTVNTETVMKIGKYKVTYDEYRCFYLRAMDEMAAGDSDYWNKADAPFDELKLMVERSLARKYAILDLVDEYNIKLSDQDNEDINATIGAYIDEYGGMTGYRQWLSVDGYTGRLFREQYILTYYYDIYLRDVLLTGIDDLIKMDEESLRADFFENFYHYTMIFIRLDDKDVYSENAQKIKDAYEALENGEDFYEVAEKYSEWKVNAEKGEHAVKDEKSIEIENKALSLAECDYSEVFYIVDEEVQGHAILMRLPLDPNYIIDNYQQLELQSGTRRYHELLDNMALEMKVKYTDYYDTLTMEMLTSSKEYFTGE